MILNGTNVANETEIRHFHVCCGLGGGARGFNRAHARVGNLRARFRCIGGVDNNPAAIADFTRATGAQGTVMDLFTLDQYIAFHGRMPPPDWREATPADLRRAAGNEHPHIVFTSSPCKGLTGLLSETMSATPKYQALNQLTLRTIWLSLEAWADDPPEFILFENVPRIMTRGRHLLDQIVALLAAYGYAVAETTHDCGELGGLAQRRKRFLLIARHRAKVPPFLYEPPKRPLRSVGEILERLPLPGDIATGGPMHRVPSLEWRTWVRLAFVEAGRDWRSLNRLRVQDGFLQDYGIVPGGQWRDDILGVLPWSATAPTVTGKAGATTGRFNVADPRERLDRGIIPGQHLRNGALGVVPWADTAGAVIGESFPSNGTFSVADPRDPNEDRRRSVMGVTDWSAPSGTVTGDARPSKGPFAVADPRRQPDRAEYAQYGVQLWDQPSQTVTAKAAAGSGPFSVGDPRIADGPNGPRFNNIYRMVAWDGPSQAVTAGSGPTGGGICIADPRPGYPAGAYQNIFRVVPFDQPASTVIGANHVTGGAGCVADPRFPAACHPKYRVTSASTVPDPRCPWKDTAHANKMAVVGCAAPSQTITSSDRVGSGALSIADPLPNAFRNGREHYATAGHYGVQPWAGTSGAVTGSGQHDNGYWTVADPRPAEGDQVAALPDPNTRMVAVIQALDGTWHRPFTTLDLAALQSLFDPEDLPFCLEGSSDTRWREAIGNAVPSDSAEAIATQIGITLLLAWTGHTIALTSTPIWVRPLAIALSVDPATPAIDTIH